MSRIGQALPHPEWRIIVEEFLRLDYGQAVSHEALSAATGLEYPSQPYYRHVGQAARVLLREHDRVMVCVPTVGYKRLEPKEHGRETRRFVRLGTKRIKRGTKVARVTPLELLTPEQSKELEHAMVLLRALNTQMHGMYRSFKNLLPPVKAAKQTTPAANEGESHAVN